jgi:Domain of unknown function (DUF4276)
VSVRVYVEGGGNCRHSDTNTACRRGFVTLFAKLGLPPRNFGVIPCGSRTETHKDFCTALKQSKADFIILLVDSEAPVAGGAGSWAHLKAQDNWDRPRGVTEDQAHLMVQCMEAWFLADREALERFYGSGFVPRALPGWPNIEQAPKPDLISALERATRGTSKGKYDKVKHGFALLAQINVEQVRARSERARRLFDTLLRQSRGRRPDRSRLEPHRNPRPN